METFGTSMGYSLCPLVADIFMETFELIVLNSFSYKPKVFRYLVETFIILNHSKEIFNQFKYIIISNLQWKISLTILFFLAYLLLDYLTVVEIIQFFQTYTYIYTHWHQHPSQKLVIRSSFYKPSHILL